MRSRRSGGGRKKLGIG